MSEKHTPGPVWLIYFDDYDRRPEIITNEDAARERYRQISESWNAHLFVKVQSNSRDCPYYAANATLASPDLAAEVERLRADLDVERRKVEALRPTQAAADVLAERHRQVEAKGWTPEHDDEHDGGQLAAAASAYALAAADHLHPLSQGDGCSPRPTSSAAGASSRRSRRAGRSRRSRREFQGSRRQSAHARAGLPVRVARAVLAAGLLLHRAARAERAVRRVSHDQRRRGMNHLLHGACPLDGERQRQRVVAVHVDA